MKLFKLIKLFIIRVKEGFFFTFGKYPKLRQNNYKEYWKDKVGKKKFVITDFQLARYEISYKIIKKCGNKSKSIKDVGCGTGSYLKYINEKNIFNNLIGYDLTDECSEDLLKLNILHKQINLNDNKQIKLLNTTDISVCFEVLEHLSSPENLIESMLKNTKVAIIFSVPNTGYIFHRLRLLFGSFPIQWRLNPGEHLRYWTKSDLNWWLNNICSEKNLKFNIFTYEGLPFLNYLLPSLFSMGLVGVIFVEKEH